MTRHDKARYINRQEKRHITDEVRVRVKVKVKVRIRVWVGVGVWVGVRDRVSVIGHGLRDRGRVMVRVKY